jgi:polyisoprenoid-binding protein YceI
MKMRKTRILAVSVLVLLVGGGVFLATQFFSGDAPPPVELLSPAPSTSASSTGSAEPAGDFDGQWTIDDSSGSLADASSSFAGYRIDEQLVGIGANTAVGRTQDVTGTMTIVGEQVTELEVTVDMTTLRSDDDRRDGQLTMRGLETAAFPRATFILTSPIDVGEAPAVGEMIEATATGDLTLHGVTRSVRVPIEAQWTGERIEIAASFDLTLADYEMEAPTSFIALSVADTGTVEMHLLLGRA